MFAFDCCDKSMTKVDQNYKYSKEKRDNPATEYRHYPETRLSPSTHPLEGSVQSFTTIKVERGMSKTYGSIRNVSVQYNTISLSIHTVRIKGTFPRTVEMLSSHGNMDCLWKNKQPWRYKVTTGYKHHCPFGLEMICSGSFL